MASRRPLNRTLRALLPSLSVAIVIVIWHLTLLSHPASLVPSPLAVAGALVELATTGRLFRYAVASLYRVTWGYLLAAALAIPLGVMLGLRLRVELALNPIVQLLRPISPLAWMPIAILWFGVGDLSAIFLIFLGSFFPLLVSATTAVRNVDPVFLDAGRNFGMSGRNLTWNVVYPAILPQLLAAFRITLGIAWLVVVAAEMISVNSGLGFLIIDARNAGNRYDLVVAGMVIIGAVGLLLDLGMRKLERLPSVRWGYMDHS